MKKIKSVFDNNELGISNSKTIELSSNERNILANAIAICLPKETDIIPLIELCSKIVDD